MWTGAIAQDLKYGMRQLRLNPGFTITAVLSLALGFGANAAIFGLVDQILVRLLPVDNPASSFNSGYSEAASGPNRGTASTRTGDLAFSLVSA